jgi:PhnB protein
MVVKAIPEGFHSVTPYLTVAGAADAIEFYKRAFGATEIFRLNSPDGNKIVRSLLKIGDSPIVVSDEFVHGAKMGVRSPKSIGEGSSAITWQIFTEDVDRVFDQAIAAGATVIMPVTGMFYGDRYVRLMDPFGHFWSVATHKKDVSPEQIKETAESIYRSTPGWD